MAQSYKTQDDDLLGNPDESSPGVPLSGLQCGKGPGQIVNDNKNKKPLDSIIDWPKKKGAQGSQGPANRQKNAG